MVNNKPSDNRLNLPTVVVSAQISPARVSIDQLFPDRTGMSRVLPASGGVCLNLHPGDAVDLFIGDHLLPGASVEDEFADPTKPGPAHLLGCVGNRVYDAHGDQFGVVTGKRGGLAPGLSGPHLISVDAPDKRLAEAVPGDKLNIHACGRGLALDDYPEVTLLNCSPQLLDALALRADGERIEVVVRALLPSFVVAAGMGQDGWVGDLEFVTSRPVVPDLALGDLIAFADIDSAPGRFHRPGFVSIGVVAHGSSPRPGHGIGVTILMSGPTTALIATPGATGSVAQILRRWGAG